MGQSTEARLVETEWEDFGTLNLALRAEVKLEVSTMLRCGRVEGCFRVSERFEQGEEVCDLVGKPALGFRR